MDHWDSLVKVIEIFQALALPIAAVIMNQCRQILQQLKTLNGRVIKIETWQNSHEQLDTERFQSVQRELDHLDRVVSQFHSVYREGEPHA